MLDHWCNGHDTEVLPELFWYGMYQLIYVKFRSLTQHMLCCCVYWRFRFPPLSDHQLHTKYSIRTHFQNFWSVVLQLESFSNSLDFSDLFRLVNMPATAITSEPSRQVWNQLWNRVVNKTNKKGALIFKIEVNTKPIDFQLIKSPHLIFWSTCWATWHIHMRVFGVSVALGIIISARDGLLEMLWTLKNVIELHQHFFC